MLLFCVLIRSTASGRLGGQTDGHSDDAHERITYRYELGLTKYSKEYFQSCQSKCNPLRQPNRRKEEG